ncbi:MAG: ROK family protein [Planctomycetota bacterium]
MTLTIGIDLGGTNVRAGVVAEGHKVLGSASTKTKPEQGVDAVLDRIEKVVEKAIDDADVKRKDITRAGIGAPGAVDIDTGVVLQTGNMGWRDVPLADLLSKRLEVPVAVDNDVNVGAWGEHVAGAGRGFGSMIAIFIGTGVGAGIVLNGKLFHGHHHTAGEIGQTIIQAGSPLGRRSVEDLASRTAIAANLVSLIRSNHPSIVPDLVDGDLTRVRSKAINTAFAEGDPLTRRVVQEACAVIAAAAANAVTLLSLPCVVFGGGLAEAMGQRLLPLIREPFEDAVFPDALRRCELRITELGDDAGVIGAAGVATAAHAG